ncbi:MAG: LVIVD repeat-containing protein, partial [Dolichospermum sp.]
FTLEGFVSNIQVLGNYAYVSAGNRGLKIIDISNPASPSLRGEYSYHHSGEAYDVQVVGNYAYVAFGLYGLEIIDISNPSSPILAGSYKPSTRYSGQTVTNTVTSVEVVNNYAYLTVRAARDLGGLWILDISQFTNTNTFTGTPNADTLTGTNGADTLIGLAGNDTYTVNNAG